jgi:hypothetical protein
MEFEDYKAEKRQQGVDLAKAMTQSVNTMSFEKEFMAGFIEEMTTSHPTLQQGVMRLIYQLMIAWSKRHFDGRNEATVKFCQEVDKIECSHFPFI